MWFSFFITWEQRKFAEVYSLASEGGTPNTNIDAYYLNGTIPFVRIEDTENKYIDSVKTFITEEGLKHSSAWLIPSGSVIFTNGATVGNVAINRIPVATKQGILGIIPNKTVTAEYLYYLLSAGFFQREVRNRQATGTFATIILKNLNEINVFVPDKLEQRKISDYLSSIDNLITLHQRKGKCRFYQVLWKILSSKKTIYWEQRKLGEEVEITMGQSPDGSTYRETPAEYILVQGNADLKDGWVFPRVWTTQKTKTAEAGDLIMSVRAPAGAMGKTAYNVVLGRGVAAIKGSEFIFQTLVKMDSDGYWKKLAAGSTFESINSDTVSNAIISIPQQDDEQNKIGALFESIDNLITLHQRKQNIMLTFKKCHFYVSVWQHKTITWEQRKFGSMVYRANEMSDTDGLPRVEYEDIEAGQGTLNKDLKEKVSTKKGIVFQYGDILYGKLRPYLKNWLFAWFSGIAVGDFWVLRSNLVSHSFIFRLVQTPAFDHIANQSTGSKMPRADWNLVSNSEFTLPLSTEEQEAIGQIFLKLDNLITLHQRGKKYIGEIKNDKRNKTE